MLTDAQKGQFDTLGFLLFRNLIPPDEMQTYIDAFNDTMTRANGGVPWPHAPRRHQVFPFYRHNPPVYNRLLDHEVIDRIVEDLIGPDYVFTVSEGIYHFTGTPWHHDDVSPVGHVHLKVVLFLDPVRAHTGCLSVLPGSHFRSYREHMERHGKTLLSLGPDVPGRYAIETDPGDVIVFDVKTYHGAFGDAIRRGIYVNYMQNPRTPDEAHYITHIYRRDSAHCGSYYTPELFEDAPPRRLRMLKFLKANCYDPAAV
jgi:ectoine hydroxylase-related dioxygenase (phytanoyl-CoA dioxygenase family)